MTTTEQGQLDQNAMAAFDAKYPLIINVCLDAAEANGVSGHDIGAHGVLAIIRKWEIHRTREMADAVQRIQAYT